MNSQTPILEITNLSKNFNNICAVDKVNFCLNTGTITAVIGPNGAGKTTLYRLMSGELKSTGGSVKLKGKEILGLSPDKIVKAGIGRSFQITSVFPALTVLQNIRVAAASKKERHFDFWQNVKGDRSLNQTAENILALVGIEHLAPTPVNNLSHGDRSLVEIALVLALEPGLILLDEPTAGMGREEANKIVELIRKVQQETDCTFLITEHDMEIVFNLAEEIIVMHQGKILAKGKPDEISNNEEVRRAYLGN